MNGTISPLSPQDVKDFPPRLRGPARQILEFLEYGPFRFGPSAGLTTVIAAERLVDDGLAVAETNEDGTTSLRRPM